jgi:PAS domain S-box-containing protein
MAISFRRPAISRSGVQRFFWQFISLWLGISFFLQCPVAAQVNQVRRVLILDDLGTVSSPGFAEVGQALFLGLQNSPFQIELYQENLQVSLFPDEISQRRFRTEFIRKYSGRKPDLIITVGPASLKFIAELHERFVQDTPIVFCAVLGEIPELVNSDKHFTGVWGRLHPEETLNAALHMLPGTKHVVVVGGVGKLDDRLETVAKEAFQNYESKLEFKYFTDLTMPDLLERLKNLPSHTIVYHTAITQDSAGIRFIDSTQSVPLVARAAQAPVFVMDDLDLRAGTVGGDLVNWGDDGRVAAEMAVRVLNGEKPEYMPIVTSNHNYTFDWRALQRWGLNESNLPADSVVLNKPPSLWETYARYIVTGLILLVVQAMAIFALLWQRAERRKTEASLRLSMEAGRSVGWEWDMANGHSYWFGNLQTMFGIPSDDIFGRVGDFYRYVHPEDREEVEKALADARQRRKPFIGEFRVVRVDGATRWVASRGEFDNEGKAGARHMRGMAVDITERKAIEERLKESQTRLEGIVKTAMDAVIAIDDHQRIVVFNTAAEKMFGCSEQDAIGTSINRFIPERFRTAHSARIHQFDQSEVANRELRGSSLFGLRVSGEEFPIQTSISRTLAGGKKILTVMIRDVTERRRAEEALASVGRRLIEAQEKERTWIARELHDDFNQRIILLAMNLDTLKQDLSSSNGRVNRCIEEASKQTSELASDIHALSHRLHSSKLELLGLAGACHGFCRELSERQNIEVAFHTQDLPKNLPEQIALCLFRVLQEALQNAIKHSGVRRFDVSLKGTPSEILLAVHDSGVGFDPEEAISGHGLGLISMRERLKLVDGQLSIDSKLQQGTTIHACVPLSSKAKLVATV